MKALDQFGHDLDKELPDFAAVLLDGIMETILDTIGPVMFLQRLANICFDRHEEGELPEWFKPGDIMMKASKQILEDV